MTDVPFKYLGVVVPDPIRVTWRGWEGVAWREHQHYAKGGLFPPDLRFGVDMPDLCRVHVRMWRQWRDKRFDPVTAQRWPGTGLFGHLDPGGITIQTTQRKRELLAERRLEWDVRSREEMRAIECLCLSGSTQCAARSEVDRPPLDTATLDGRDWDEYPPIQRAEA